MVECGFGGLVLELIDHLAPMALQSWDLTGRQPHQESGVQTILFTAVVNLLKSETLSILVSGTSVEEPNYKIPVVAYKHMEWLSLLETSRGS